MRFAPSKTVCLLYRSADETRAMNSKQKRICPVCKKEIKPDSASGSLTAFLFQQDRCLCDESSKNSVDRLPSDPERCLSCGMVVQHEAASITSFLFADLTCRCARAQALSESGAESGQSRKASNQALMATKFQRQTGLLNQSASGSNEKRRGRKAGDAAALLNLREGEVVGNYKLIKLIGEGGMAIVFLAEHIALDRICALKFLAPSMVTRAGWMMFQKEAKILAGLNHPSICRIYDLGVHEGTLPFYAM